MNMNVSTSVAQGAPWKLHNWTKINQIFDFHVCRILTQKFWHIRESYIELYEANEYQQLLFNQANKTWFF